MFPTNHDRQPVQWTIPSGCDEFTRQLRYYNPNSGNTQTSSSLVMILHSAARHAHRTQQPMFVPTPDRAWGALHYLADATARQLSGNSYGAH